MKKVLLIVGCVVLLSIVGTLTFLNFISDDSTKNPEGLLKIKDFSYGESENAVCAALMPGCGYCNGQVIDNECYVTKEQFEEYKSVYSSVEVE